MFRLLWTFSNFLPPTYKLFKLNIHWGKSIVTMTSIMFNSWLIFPCVITQKFEHNLNSISYVIATGKCYINFPIHLDMDFNKALKPNIKQCIAIQQQQLNWIVHYIVYACYRSNKFDKTNIYKAHQILFKHHKWNVMEN